MSIWIIWIGYTPEAWVEILSTNPPHRISSLAAELSRAAMVGQVGRVVRRDGHPTAPGLHGAVGAFFDVSTSTDPEGRPVRVAYHRQPIFISLHTTEKPCGPGGLALRGRNASAWGVAGSAEVAGHAVMLVMHEDLPSESLTAVAGLRISRRCSVGRCQAVDERADGGRLPA